MDGYEKIPDADHEIADARKERRCLMCQIKFVSEWSGERICHRCKTRAVWRAGFRWPSGGRLS